MIWSWIIKTSIGRAAGAALGAIILSSLLYAGCQVKGCIEHNAKVEAKTAQKTLEVEREDQKVKAQVHQMSDDDLADFLRHGGVRKDR